MRGPVQARRKGEPAGGVGEKARALTLTIAASSRSRRAWGSLQATRGQQDLWRSGEVPQTHSHTAHPRRNKVRGGAREKKIRKEEKNLSSGHSSP